MAVFKEIWNFTLGQYRWSEVWYSAASSIDVAATFSNAFKAGRMALCDPATTWVDVIITDTQDPTVHKEVRIGVSGSDAAGGNAVGPANPAEAIVSKLKSATSRAVRHWWLRGLHETATSVTPETGVSRIQPAIEVVLKEFFLALQNSGYIIARRQPTSLAGFGKIFISEVNGTAGNNQSIVTTKTDHGYAVGDIVTFHRVDKKVLPGLKGAFTVLAKTNNTLTIDYSTPQNLDILTVAGYVRKYLIDGTATIKASECRFFSCATRQTKNASIGSRGAQRAARLRH